jgi:hypothetical protein
MADYGRLSAAIDEELNRLADQLEALSEVKGEYRIGKLLNSGS